MPLLVNPALAGSEEHVRASLLHRSQWKSLGVPFVSNALAVDMGIGRKNDRNKGAGLGIGLSFFKDRAGDPEFSTNQLNLQVSYALQLNDQSQISAGLNMAWDQRSVQAGTGQWASQYNGIYYDPSASSGEAFGGDRLSALHAGLGMVYSYGYQETKRQSTQPFKLRLGVAASQLGALETKRASAMRHDFVPRYLAFAEGSFGLGSGALGMEPSLQYVQQGGFDLIICGTYLRYAIIEGSSFASDDRQLYAAFGSFWRVADAAVLAARVDWGSYTLGISYDISMGNISERLPRMGAWELALVWQGS